MLFSNVVVYFWFVEPVDISEFYFLGSGLYFTRSKMQNCSGVEILYFTNFEEIGAPQQKLIFFITLIRAKFVSFSEFLPSNF